MTQTDFSDEDLTAFLDGEATDALSNAIEAALQADPVLAARLAQLDLPLECLRDAGDALVAAAPAYEAPPVTYRTSRLALAASLVLGLVLGAGAMQLLTPKTDWVDIVASYQALYVPATLAGDVQPADVTSAVISAFEAEAGVSLAGVTAIDGLTFKRAQTLGLGGNRLLQLAYVTPEGTPVAYCLTAVDDADRVAQMTRAHGLATMSWVRGGTGYVLVGDLSQSDLQAIQSALPGA